MRRMDAGMGRKLTSADVRMWEGSKAESWSKMDFKLKEAMFDQT